MANDMEQTQTAKRLRSAVLVVALAGLLGGCATSGNPKDPIEGFNRAMYGFNEAVDTVLAAWESMSRAVRHIPCVTLSNYYVGPSYLGPCHPLVPEAGATC